MSSDQLFWPAAVQTLKARLVFQPKTNKKKHKHIKMASFFFFKRTMNNVIKTYKNLLSLHIIYTRLKHLLKFLFSNFLFRNKTFSLILFKNVHFLNSSLVFFFFFFKSVLCCNTVPPGSSSALNH